MKPHRILVAAAAALAAQGASAQGVGFIRADKNGDGVIEYSEARRAFPDLKEVYFNKCDANRDGVLEKGEYPALQTIYDTMFGTR